MFGFNLPIRYWGWGQRRRTRGTSGLLIFMRNGTREMSNIMSKSRQGNAQADKYGLISDSLSSELTIPGTKEQCHNFNKQETL